MQIESPESKFNRPEPTIHNNTNSEIIQKNYMSGETFLPAASDTKRKDPASKNITKLIKNVIMR